MRSLSDLRVQTYTIIQLQVEPQMIKEGPMRYLVVSLSILIFSKLTIFWRYYSQFSITNSLLHLRSYNISQIVKSQTEFQIVGLYIGRDDDMRDIIIAPKEFGIIRCLIS